MFPHLRLLDFMITLTTVGNPQRYVSLFYCFPFMANFYFILSGECTKFLQNMNLLC